MSDSGLTLTITRRACREVHISLATTPPLRMRGVRRFGPASHLGLSVQGEGTHKITGHHQSGATEGSTLLSEGLRG